MKHLLGERLLSLLSDDVIVVPLSSYIKTLHAACMRNKETDLRESEEREER